MLLPWAMTSPLDQIFLHYSPCRSFSQGPFWSASIMRGSLRKVCYSALEPTSALLPPSAKGVFPYNSIWDQVLAPP